MRFDTLSDLKNYKNEIFQCLNGIAFLKAKEYAQSCDGKTTINLETLN